MIRSNSILFISDLHLSAQDKAGLEQFYQFIQGPAQQAKALYILGDLFDVWVGNDINREFHDEIQQAFLNLHQHNVSLFFMNGNRDFLISRSFLQKCHCQKLTDPFVISLHGHRVMLTHGDKLCTQDVVYQRYRKIVQHPITRHLFISLPKRFREKIAHNLRARSQAYQKKQHGSILDVAPEAVVKVMSDQKVKQLIHGHVHRPKIHDLSIEASPAKRLVLGDWYQKGSVIISTPTHMQLASFTTQKGLDVIQSYSRRSRQLNMR